MKVYDNKLQRVTVVFKEYEIGDKDACPECGRPFKQADIDRLAANSKISCVKCGAKLKR